MVEFGPRERSRGSIARQTLIKMAVRIAIVIVLITAAAYFHIVSSVQEQVLGQLEKYVVERGQREQGIFALAEDNHAIMKRAITERLQALGDADPQEEFARLFVTCDDGVTRNRPELYDGTKQAGVYIDESLAIDADVRRRVLVFHELCTRFGPAWRSRFQDTYISAPEGIMVLYWPEIPDWCQEATTELDIPSEQYSWVADKKHNPRRESAWTGLFFDHVAKVWMVSCETPVDIDGRHVATIGHDITLTELFDRAITDHLPGAYNVIFRGDGHLIACPEHVENIGTRRGDFKVQESGDDHLKRIFRLVSRKADDEIVVENAEHDEYLAVAPIEELDWYFVTVFPKSIVSDVAFGASRFVLLLGFCSLLVELAILFLILRKHVAAPLAEFVHATDQLARGNYDTALCVDRDDELGTLAGSFSRMRDTIRDKLAMLNREIADHRRTEESLRINEERLTFALEATSDALWDWDIITGDVYFSPRYDAMLGYAPGEITRSFEGWRRLLHPDDAQATVRIVREHIERKQPFATEFRMRTKQGGWQWILGRGKVVRTDAYGRPTRAAGTHVDIQGRKLAEHEREELISALEAQNAELERFAYTISHELKTPLITIKGYLGMLKEDLAGNDLLRAEDDMARVDNAADRIDVLLSDLLELSRVGRLINPPEDVRLDDLLRDVLEMVAGARAKCKAEITVAGNLPVVFGDKVRLQEVFENLIENAIKYMGDQPEPRIEIDALEDGGEVVCRVRDNGMGIDPCYHDKVFGLFDKLDQQTEGAGAGLAIVKRIVEVHGGRIWVESEGQGQGSVFAFSLPCRCAAASGADALQEALGPRSGLNLAGDRNGA